MGKKEDRKINRSKDKMDGNIVQSKKMFLEEFEFSLKEMQLMKNHKLPKPSWKDLFSSEDKEKLK